MTNDQRSLIEQLKGYTITVDMGGATILPTLPPDLAAAARENRRLIIWAALREEYRDAVYTARLLMRKLDDGTATVAEFHAAYDRAANIERLARHHNLHHIMADVLHAPESHPGAGYETA